MPRGVTSGSISWMRKTEAQTGKETAKAAQLRREGVRVPSGPQDPGSVRGSFRIRYGLSTGPGPDTK